MKTPLKAALLSALVFPGVGHFILKKYYAGAFLLISFSTVLYFFTHDVYSKVEQVVEKVKNGEVALDPQAISVALNNTHSDLSMQTLTIISYLILSIWLFAIVDSYRLANKLANEKIS